MPFSNFRKFGWGLATFAVAGCATIPASNEGYPYADWQVVKSVTGKKSRVRLLVPKWESEQEWTIQAREERFKGMGLLVDGEEASKLLRQRLGRACAQKVDVSQRIEELNGHKAHFIRLDCPQLREGADIKLTIMSMAWVATADLQTKQVVFKRTPTASETADALTFLRWPMEPVKWTPDT